MLFTHNWGFALFCDYTLVGRQAFSADAHCGILEGVVHPVGPEDAAYLGRGCPQVMGVHCQQMLGAGIQEEEFLFSFSGTQINGICTRKVD